ncbi:MAG: hypothetical protein NDI77_05090 [Geobacteraceae bacterium]|nr:hypothetical protein [Geobacteraceae bacterium]
MSRKSSNSCPPDEELDQLLAALRQRCSELTDDRCQRKVFLKRLKNLVRFGAEPMDYPEPEGVELPKELEVALAVCHPECGNQALVVVEGGPQGCDCCGGTMYPTEVATYRKKR